MKKLSKILCAVLVLAMLCSSLVFMVGAEEASDITSVPANGSEIVAAIKYDAEDNLFKGASLTTNTAGWNTAGGPQAHLVTNSKTGETYFHQFTNGRFDLNEGASDGNEFINFTFESVSLKYEAGYREYVIVDYDVAYKAVAGNYNTPNGEKKAWGLKQEVIVRGSSAGTSWATVQPFADMAGEEFVHATTVYDYASGDAYTFINGVLTKTYTNGALSSGVLPTYLAGESLTTSEWRVGSNSFDEVKLNNVYIRHEKLADASNTLSAAIKSGKLSDWDGNVYVGFVPTVSHEDVAVDALQGVNDNVIASTEGNILSGSVFQNHQEIYTIASSAAGKDAYATVYANADGNVDKKNPGWWFTIDTKTVDKLSVAEGATGFYVIDLDMSTSGDVLPYIDISPALRRASDVGGWPFGTSVQAGNYLTSGEWAHFTIVGDIANNTLHVFVNGEYKAIADTVAYKVSELKDPATGEINTEIIPQSIRIEFSISSIVSNYTKGMNITVDNVCQRVYTSADLSGGLREALDAKSISTWSGNIAGRAGEKLPTIATIDGVAYSSADEIKAALAANAKEAKSVEFKSTPIAPINFKANATINTNGLDINTLVKFDEACSKPVVDGDNYTVTLGYSANYSVKDVTSGDVDINVVKYDDPGNILSRVSLVNYHADDHRHINYITNLDTGDVFVNDFPVGTINNSSNTYLEIKPNGNIEYKKGIGQTIIFDFDMAVYDRETASLNLISRYGSGSGAWGNSSMSTADLFKNVDLGEFQHVTIVISVDSRMGYYFLNNKLVRADENIITEQAERMQDLRCFGNSYADLAYDNICIRHINNTEIEAIAKEGDLSKWSAAIYGDDYKLPASPAVATVDGVSYPTVDAVNKVLSVDGDAAKVVQILHVPFKGEDRTFRIRTASVIDTQGLDVSLDWNTGIYEFDPQNENYISSETGLAYASSKLIHTSVGDVHTFTTIDASNCMNTATPVTWFYDDTIENYDVVFYVFGDTIAPLSYNAFIEDGVYYQDEWKEITLVEDSELGYVVGDILDEFPVASGALEEKLYMYELVTKDVDFIVTDIKLGAVVNSSIELTVYVNKYETLTTGEVVVLDGVEYVALRYELAPHEIDKLVEAKFIVTDSEGNEYTQLQRVSFLDYAKDVLSGEYTDADKKVVANLLAYANEASVLFNGAKIDAVTALLETYASYVTTTELPEALDTASLASVIRSAALRLNGTPEFVFKVARGFNGTLTFTYEGVTGPVEVKIKVDATSGEKLVSLPVDVCDLQADITITAGNVSGVYNLATYAQGIENNAFATALYNYSAAAKAHKSNLVFVYVLTGYETDKDGNLLLDKPIIEVYGEYTPGSKINIPFLHDGLTITWYLGTGEDREVIDINNFVITENVTLSYTEVINSTILDNVTVEALKSINNTLVKNFDSYSFVTAVKDGKPVEAIRLTKTSPWAENTDIMAFWADQGYTLDSSRKVVSISFDYLVLGSVGKHQAPSGESYSENIFQIKYTDAAVIELGLDAPEKIVDYGTTVIVEDGAWHTFTYVASTPVELDSFVIRMYKLYGDMLIANIDVEYAPLETYNADGSLNTTVILAEHVTDKALTTIVEGKIKQFDQTNEAPEGDHSYGYFVKEQGKAAYVKAVKNGEYVESVYLSRSVDWDTYASVSSQNGFKSEFRFAIDNTKRVTSISFDYLLNGSLTLNRNTAEYSIFQIKYTNKADNTFNPNDQYFNVITDKDNDEITLFETDGEWHSFTYEFESSVQLDNFLIILSEFQGEFLLSNLVVTYAE